MVGGNFINRFNISGRSYKVIPLMQRTSRLTPEQLTSIQVTGPGGQLVTLGSLATLSLNDPVAVGFTCAPLPIPLPLQLPSPAC